MNKAFIFLTGIILLNATSVQAQTPLVTLEDMKLSDANASSNVKNIEQWKSAQSAQRLSQKMSSSDNYSDTKRKADAYLKSRPKLLEGMLYESLTKVNKKNIRSLTALYKTVPNRDESLIDWGNAILLADTDPNRSISEYRKLISHFPNNDYIRFQLSEALFKNKELEAAKTQFEKLRASKRISPQDVAIFDQYIASINKKQKWNFSLSGTYLNDKNLDNTAEAGTIIYLNNGATLTYDTPREEGQGLSMSVGASRKWDMKNDKYLSLRTNVSGKYYWDNKDYNTANLYLGLGYGHSGARLNYEITPFISNSWDKNKETHKFKRNYMTVGSAANVSYWATPSFKSSANVRYGYDKYSNKEDAERNNGHLYSAGTNFMYMPKSTQYFSVGFDVSKRDAKADSNDYTGKGIDASWGQEWPKGFSTLLNTGVTKNTYDETTYLAAGNEREDTSYITSASVWNKKVHFSGITPRVTWKYTEKDSNVPIYSYDKNQVFLEFNKSF